MGEDNLDFEKMFNNEVREKKRTATGVFHRASRRGYVKGGVRTQVDFLRGKEKKAYIKGGEIKVSNLYDVLENVPTIEELDKMEYEVAKKIIERAKMNFSTLKLKKHWGVTSYTMYKKLYPKYNIEIGEPKGGKKKTKVAEEITNAPVATTTPERDFTGFVLKFAGEHDASFISDRVLAFLSTMSENGKYRINFELVEIKEDK